MNYSRSYTNTLSLADRIRESAKTGQVAKPAGGLASRETRREESLEAPDFEEIRARYLNFVQEMFTMPAPSAPTEEDFVDIEEYLDSVDEGDSKPRRNPKHFAADVETGNLSERDLLAMTLQAEAGGEGELGMLAAGAVIANRVNAGGYGDTYRDVILAPGQFSAWNSLTGYAGGEGGLDMSAIRASETAYAVADRILSGDYESPVGGATHYYNPNVADPDWGKKAGGQWTTIGNHVFGYGS